MDLVGTFGALKSFSLVKDFATQKSKGYCFFSYVVPSVADTACVGLHGLTLGSQTISCHRCGKYVVPEGETQTTGLQQGDTPTDQQGHQQRIELRHQNDENFQQNGTASEQYDIHSQDASARNQQPQDTNQMMQYPEEGGHRAEHMGECESFDGQEEIPQSYPTTSLEPLSLGKAFDGNLLPQHPQHQQEQFFRSQHPHFEPPRNLPPAPPQPSQRPPPHHFPRPTRSLPYLQRPNHPFLPSRPIQHPNLLVHQHFS